MKKFTHIVAGVVGFLALAAPLAITHADGASLTVTSLTPGATVYAKDSMSFNLSPVGFTSPTYTFSDSFPNSTATISNISVGGTFFWVPVPGDVGTHVLTIGASDYSGNTATITQTIVVAAAPSIAIQSLSPGTTVGPGTKLTFSIVPTGFVNPTYSISDPFGNGSTISSANIDAQGNFSWTPDLSQNGDHTISIYAYDSSGHNATKSQSIHVGGYPTLSVSQITPGVTIPVGTVTTFMMAATNYLPSSFGVSDSFYGSTITNNNISATGLFNWAPLPSDIGVHTLTILGSVGPYGQSTTTKQTLIVYAAGGAPPSSTPTATPVIAPPPTIAPPLPTTSSSFTFTLSLKIGSEGNEVTQLQKVLAALGFFTGTPSGYYGALTSAAVMKFQAAHGLEQLGIVGPGTRAVLNGQSNVQTTTNTTPPTTGNGYVFKYFMGYGEDMTDGPDVMELQKRLIALGYLSGDATGYFGTATQTAVQKYQTAKGIKATGYVGAITRAALNQ